MTALLIVLLGGSVLLLSVAVSHLIFAWAENPGRIVPGWMRKD